MDNFAERELGAIIGYNTYERVEREKDGLDSVQINNYFGMKHSPIYSLNKIPSVPGPEYFEEG